MTTQALYLFKAARRPRHLKENLNLLAVERGSIVEVAYNHMWVAPEYFDEGTIRRGTKVYFVFTDRPYSLFVPVREGEVVAVARGELMLRIRVLLHSWVGVEDRDLADFTRLVKQTSPSRAPGQKFVLPKHDGVPLVSYYDEREDEGWRRTIENVLAMSAESEDDPYRGSVFFRPLGLRVGAELHRARQLPVDAGSGASLALRFHNPHLGEDDVARHELRVLASDDLLVEAPGRLPLTGELDVPFEVVGDDPELTVKVGPAPAEHTSITQRLVTHGHEARVHVESEPAGEVERAELGRLFDVVWRNARFEPGDDLDVLDAFQRLLPGEQRIGERCALILAERGQDDEAYAILRELNPETLGDKARMALFRLVLVRESDDGAMQRVDSLELTADGRFDAFLETLAALNDTLITRLMPTLVATVSADQLRPLMDRLGDRVRTIDAATDVADALYLNSEDPTWAYSWLRDHGRRLRTGSPKLTKVLVELKNAGATVHDDDELTGDAARLITNLIAEDEVTEARSWLLKAAGSLSRAEKDRLYHRVADRFIEKKRHDSAIEVLVEHAWAACEHGDLADATEAVQRARGLWTASPEGRNGEAPPEWLLEALERVHAAWRECAELVEWRQSDEARIRDALRTKYLNQHLLIAGGIRRQDWLERVQAMTGATIDWAAAYRDETDNLGGFAERIRSGQYEAVVHLWQKSGHEVGDRLKPVCKTANVPWLQATSAGVRGVLEALTEG